jgi:MinD superfamily P-loop ATPase
MTMQKLRLISLSDLQHICIECQQCHAKVTLNMSERSAHGEKYNFFAPKECPGCRTPYDSALREAIDEWQKLYPVLVKLAANSVMFHGNSEPES